MQGVERKRGPIELPRLSTLARLLSCGKLYLALKVYQFGVPGLFAHKHENQINLSLPLFLRKISFKLYKFEKKTH